MGRGVDIVLRVRERDLGDGRSELGFRLEVSGLVPETFSPVTIRRSSVGSDPFEDLLPEELHRRLWSLRSPVRRARIETNESWIPWEKLAVRGPGGELQDGPAFAKLSVKREKTQRRGRKKAMKPSRRGSANREAEMIRRPPEHSRGYSSGPEDGPSEPPPKEGYWLGIDDGDDDGHDSWRGAPSSPKDSSPKDSSPKDSSPEDTVKEAPAEPEPKEVQVSTVVPEAVRPGESFLVEVIFHLEDHEVVAGPGSVVLPKETQLSLVDGTRLIVRLVPVDEGVSLVDDSEAAIEWKPPSRRAEFLLRTSRDAGDGAYHVTLEIWLDRVRLARSYLQIVVDPQSAGAPRQPSRVFSRVPRTFFASYSRRDKDRVLDRIAALTSVGIDVFLDNLDIRQGADWQDVLHREISSREQLLLFWSSAARDSKWVDKEWRYALEKRGIDYILPNALEPPERCPPPAELGRLNFGSVIDRLRRDWHEA